MNISINGKWIMDNKKNPLFWQNTYIKYPRPAPFDLC
jgi:hypothetical protein